MKYEITHLVTFTNDDNEVKKVKKKDNVVIQKKNGFQIKGIITEINDRIGLGLDTYVNTRLQFEMIKFDDILDIQKIL